MIEMRYVKYICQECGAEDTEKLFPNEQVVPYVNCWKCGSGRGKNIDQMHMGECGMKAQLEDETVEQESLASA